MINIFFGRLFIDVADGGGIGALGAGLFQLDQILLIAEVLSKLRGVSVIKDRRFLSWHPYGRGNLGESCPGLRASNRAASSHSKGDAFRPRSVSGTCFTNQSTNFWGGSVAHCRSFTRRP